MVVYFPRARSSACKSLAAFHVKQRMALSLTSKGREERPSRFSPEVAGGEKNERLNGLDDEVDRRFTNEVEILQDELEMHSSYP
jgi:hypothetical protein